MIKVIGKIILEAFNFILALLDLEIVKKMIKIVFLMRFLQKRDSNCILKPRVRTPKFCACHAWMHAGFQVRFYGWIVLFGWRWISVFGCPNSNLIYRS